MILYISTSVDQNDTINYFANSATQLNYAIPFPGLDRNARTRQDKRQ